MSLYIHRNMVAEGGYITRLWLFSYWNNCREVSRRKDNVYLRKRKDKEVMQEALLWGFLVRAHMLDIIEFQEIKKEELKRNTSQDWNKKNEDLQEHEQEKRRLTTEIIQM